jgi:hypothetical protein
MSCGSGPRIRSRMRAWTSDRTLVGRSLTAIGPNHLRATNIAYRRAFTGLGLRHVRHRHLPAADDRLAGESAHGPRVARSGDGRPDPSARWRRRHRHGSRRYRGGPTPWRRACTRTGRGRRPSHGRDPGGGSQSNIFSGVQLAIQGRSVGKQLPWKRIDHLEIAALEYIDQLNRRQLFGEIGLPGSSNLMGT